MLKKIAKRVNKELAQARDYVDQAYLVKHKSPDTAQLFITLSKEELEHAQRLLKRGQEIVNTDPSIASMYDKSMKTEIDQHWHEKWKAIWEWETGFAMEEYTDIEYRINQYRSMS